MYQSKVSAVKSQNWDNFSVMRNSKAAGFIPIPCPTHSNYSITNICKAPGCIEPLCPECITAHVQLHQQTKKPSKIQNIINTRLNCIDKLCSILQQLNSDYKKYENSYGSNLQGFLQKNRKKIQFAKTKIQNFVNKYFEQLQQKLQLLEIAYLNQRQKKSKQMKVKLTPLITHIQQISQYKNQLQSQDYIPALIQLLNDPPKKPQTINKIQYQDYGQVKIDEQSFQNFKISIQQFVNVKSLLPEQNKFTQQINKNNSRFSNQMKFSKIGRSSSRQLIQSQIENINNSNNNINESRMSRSNSRKKIFSNEKRPDSNSRINTYNNINNPMKQIPKINIRFQQKQQRVSIIDNIYFKYDKGILVYFQPYQKYFYSVQTSCADGGFDKYQLPQNITVPFDHQCIVTPDCKVFLIGGVLQNNTISNIYEIVFEKVSNRSNLNTISIKTLSPMKQARCKFSAVYYNQYIYVCGGKKGKQILSSCQRYDIKNNKWQLISPMNQALYHMNVCVFNNKIFKFGGILQTGQILNKIDIYLPQYNKWLSYSSQIPFFIKMGCTQINSNQVIIFGGQTQFNFKKSQCYLLTQQKNNQFKISSSLTTLYDQSSFQSSVVYRNTVLAIQNAQINKGKIIMQLNGGKWRFLAC